MRWIAWSLQLDLYSQVGSDDSNQWPENTVLHQVWTGVDDVCLEAQTDFIRQEPIVHLSLHFDGVRVDAERVRRSGNFKEEADHYVFDRTGYRVELVRKEHSC